MRHLLYIGNIFIAALFCICVASCSEEYSSPLKGQTVSDQVFGDGANSETITIGNSDLSKCTIVSNADWCSASIQGSSVTISVQANDTYDERQATITLTDPEDATTLSFIVVQKQNDAIFVDESTFNVPEEGGIVTVKIESNVDYEVELPAEGWITILNGTRGLKKSELSLKVALNNSGNVRKGIVKIVNKGTGTYESIIIKQTLVPRVEVDHSYIDVDESGDNITVNVKSNVEIANINTNVNWISVSGKKQVDGFNFSIIIKIQPMSGEYYRTGMVSLESSNGRIMSLIKVNQQVYEVLSVDKTSFSVDYKGGDIYLTVTSNAGYTMTNTGWILMSRLSYDDYIYGAINKIPYKFTIEPNDSDKERNGTIKLKGKTKEVTVIVNQAGNPNPDITKYISSYTHVEFWFSGLFGSTSAYARIENNSPYSIFLNEVKMSTPKNGTIFVKYYDSVEMFSGASLVEYYGEHFPTLDMKGFECKWTYTYNGKEYTVRGVQR